MLVVRNCWYVAAWSTDLTGDALLPRTILGEPIVLYRAADGQVVCMEDRCCHRLAPLSLGERDGDALRCLYHGFKFDRTGACIEIPGPDDHPALGLRADLPGDGIGWMDLGVDGRSGKGRPGVGPTGDRAG